jgi:hypothetical protein
MILSDAFYCAPILPRFYRTGGRFALHPGNSAYEFVVVVQSDNKKLH